MFMYELLNFWEIIVQVIFSALDARVKNLVQEYFLQNKRENDQYNQVLEILNSTTLENEIGGQKEFVSLAETLKQLVTQNIAKEEKQVKFFFFKFHLNQRTKT